MFGFKTRIALIAALSFTMAFLVGCAPNSYPVKTPTPSKLAFSDVQNTPVKANVVDKRRTADQMFHVGVLPSTLQNEGKPIEPVNFLISNVEKELKNRGINIQISSQDTGQDGIHILLNKFRIRNHRASGFSPYFTFTTISADIDAASGKQRVTAYFKNGKVPVWSFDEVIEPCYNIPVSHAVKEFASKINRLTTNYKISDSELDSLVAIIKGADMEKDYLEVYKLGYSNNPKAIPVLVELTKHDKDLVRIAALSSLGTIGAKDQLSYLMDVYKTAPWQERNMALKSIGDIGTPEALDFVKKAMGELQMDDSDPNAKYTREVAGLYL